MDFLKNTPILYINLEHRQDRRISTIKQFSQFGIEPTRFNAIVVPNMDGAFGCSESHLKCLQIAKENKWDRVFICEDDIIFINPKGFLSKLESFLETHSWDVLLVGGINHKPFIDVDDTCVKITNCNSTTGYIVKAAYYDKLINNIMNGLNLKYNTSYEDIGKYSIDQYLKILQNQDKWFMLKPPTVIQASGYSDIGGGDFNWIPLFLNYDNPDNNLILDYLSPS